jgi:hypothetical protein
MWATCSMRSASGDDAMPEKLYTCDKCFCTVLDTLTVLIRKHKWVRYSEPDKPWSLLLCPDCIPPGTALAKKGKAA